LVLALLPFLTLGVVSLGSWELTEKFRNVAVGDWVRLLYTGGAEHLLFVAARDENTVTLEEVVREEGYRTSWTQIVVDLEKKLPVVVRERMPGGQIREVKIEGEKSNLDEDFYALLRARFWEQPETERVVVPAGDFRCKVYHGVYNERFIRIYFSQAIPLYPVKVFIPSYNLTIRLAAFGKGMKSRFLPEENVPSKENVGGKPAEEK
jgi:hypothetical protein